MRNTRNKKVSFGGANRKGFTKSTAKRIFEQTDRAFDKNAVTVEIIPMMSAARQTGVKAKVFVRISIGAFVGITGARIVADTNGINRAFHFDGFVTDIFEPERAIFTAANTMIDKRSFVARTEWSTMLVKIGVSGRRITEIERNTDTVEVKIITEHRVIVILVKRRIGEESMVRERGMRVEEVGKDGFQRGRIADFLI